MSEHDGQPADSIIDTRGMFREALDWVHGLITAVPPERLASSTVCPGWDVQTLIGHLIGMADQARVVAEGASPFSVPLVASTLPGIDLSVQFDRAKHAASSAWSDDTLLEQPVKVPWGEFPGAIALLGYVQEAVVHGWDLAVATGQHCEGPVDTAYMLLEGAKTNFPADQRGGQVPFGEPVQPRAGAGLTEQLANWLGHARPAAAG